MKREEKRRRQGTVGESNRPDARILENIYNRKSRQDLVPGSPQPVEERGKREARRSVAKMGRPKRGAGEAA